MPLTLAHKSHNPPEAMVIYSLLKAGGFNPFLENYHHGQINIAGLMALDGIRIMLPESEISDARDFVHGEFKALEFDPIPSRKKREIVQGSVLTANPFFFTFFLKPVYLPLLWILLFLVYVFLLDTHWLRAIADLSVYGYLIYTIMHARYVSLPKLQKDKI